MLTNITAKTKTAKTNTAKKSTSKMARRIVENNLQKSAEFLLRPEGGADAFAVEGADLAAKWISMLRKKEDTNRSIDRSQEKVDNETTKTTAPLPSHIKAVTTSAPSVENAKSETQRPTYNNLSSSSDIPILTRAHVDALFRRCFNDLSTKIVTRLNTLEASTRARAETDERLGRRYDAVESGLYKKDAATTANDDEDTYTGTECRASSTTSNSMLNFSMFRPSTTKEFNDEPTRSLSSSSSAKSLAPSRRAASQVPNPKTIIAELSQYVSRPTAVNLDNRTRNFARPDPLPGRSCGVAGETSRRSVISETCANVATAHDDDDDEVTVILESRRPNASSTQSPRRKRIRFNSPVNDAAALTLKQQPQQPLSIPAQLNLSVGRLLQAMGVSGFQSSNGGGASVARASAATASIPAASISPAPLMPSLNLPKFRIPQSTLPSLPPSSLPPGWRLIPPTSVQRLRAQTSIPATAFVTQPLRPLPPPLQPLPAPLRPLPPPLRPLAAPSGPLAPRLRPVAPALIELEPPLQSSPPLNRPSLTFAAGAT